ncbi:ABC transporter ATP-binding protein [Patescibacteria group bacterium]|nr:ABC transporter ATP-binding protein [Patescibacteria group bacterium]
MSNTNREPIITFSHVTKKFSLQTHKTFKEFLPALFRGQQTKNNFTALSDINFTINRGETVGIIGPNGSGKSTILKLIAGVMTPTSGTVSVLGKVSPLIELGAGFHPELTGRENIRLNAAILGLGQQAIDQKMQHIIDFSELAEFIDQPIKHYSSGMYARLGFSIAINVDPEILLVDEILAVGDQDFQKKCIRQMISFKKQGMTIVFVSHNQEIVTSFCQKVIYLDHSRLIKFKKI